MYDTTYGVPHSVPGMLPKGSVLVAVSGDLTVYVAGHQREATHERHATGQRVPTDYSGRRSLAEGKARGRPRWNFVSRAVEIRRPRNSVCVLPSITLFLGN